MAQFCPTFHHNLALTVAVEPGYWIVVGVKVRVLAAQALMLSVIRATSAAAGPSPARLILSQCDQLSLLLSFALIQPTFWTQADSI